MSDRPFRIALVGDFGAHAHREPSATGRALAARRALRVDRDSVDDALARIAPTLVLELPVDGGAHQRVDLAPRTLDDFRPEHLVATVGPLRDLAAMRDVPPTSSPPAAAADRTAVAPPPVGRAEGAESLGLLEQIVGEALPPYTPAPTPPRAGDAELDAFVRQVVSKHLVREPDARARAWAAEVDDAVSVLLRAVLHHPELQSLEARWRAVDLLARRLDTDETLQLWLVDASKAELLADLTSDDDGATAESGIARALTESMQSPALVVGLLALDDSPEDAALARRLARLGRIIGAPWIADADHRLAGAPEPLADLPDPDDWTVAASAAWSDTRREPDARWLALAAPRVLARLPYGKAGDPCEGLTFEETPEEQAKPAPSAHFLWGSAAALVALLHGEAFVRDGWDLVAHDEVSGLPLFIRRVADEPAALPCAELPMSERAARRLLERGILPVAWLRDSDAVKLPRIQSIAEPTRALAGRWRTSP